MVEKGEHTRLLTAQKKWKKHKKAEKRAKGKAKKAEKKAEATGGHTDGRTRGAQTKQPKLNFASVSAEQAEITVLKSASELSSRALDKKDTKIAELEAEISDLRPLPIKTADGSIRPMYMALMRAVMLECGVTEEKLPTVSSLCFVG